MISVGPPPGTPINMPQNNYSQPRDINNYSQPRDNGATYIQPKKINIVQQGRVLSAQESQYRSPQPYNQPQINSPRNNQAQIYSSINNQAQTYGPPQAAQGYQTHTQFNQPQRVAQNTGNAPNQLPSNPFYQPRQNSYMKW